MVNACKSAEANTAAVMIRYRFFIALPFWSYVIAASSRKSEHLGQGFIDQFSVGFALDPGHQHFHNLSFILRGRFFNPKFSQHRT